MKIRASIRWKNPASLKTNSFFLKLAILHDIDVSDSTIVDLKKTGQFVFEDFEGNWWLSYVFPSLKALSGESVIAALEKAGEVI